MILLEKSEMGKRRYKKPGFGMICLPLEVRGEPGSCIKWDK